MTTESTAPTPPTEPFGASAQAAQAWRNYESNLAAHIAKGGQVPTFSAVADRPAPNTDDDDTPPPTPAAGKSVNAAQVAQFEADLRTAKQRGYGEPVIRAIERQIQAAYAGALDMQAAKTEVAQLIERDGVTPEIEAAVSKLAEATADDGTADAGAFDRAVLSGYQLPPGRYNAEATVQALAVARKAGLPQSVIDDFVRAQS